MIRFGSGGEFSSKLGRFRQMFGPATAGEQDEALDATGPVVLDEHTVVIDATGPVVLDGHTVVIDVRDSAASILVSPTFALSTSSLETRSLQPSAVRSQAAGRSRRYENLAPEQAADAIFKDLSEGKIEAVEDGLRYYERRPHIEPRGFIKAAERLNASFWYAVSAAYKQQAMRERVG